MRFFKPQEITIADSSIPLHSDTEGNIYAEWDKDHSYIKGDIKSYGGQLFEAYTNIYPLATYSWNDPSNNSTAIVAKLTDGTTVTPTVVPCVKDETVVYIEDTWQDPSPSIKGNYYLFTGTTGDIDFTSVDPTNPSQFEIIKNYRHEILTPTLDTGDLYWKYLGATNRNKCVDKSYNSQSQITATEVWWDFELTNPSSIVLFNIKAESASIKIYGEDINDPVWEDTKTDIYDFSSIVNWATLVRYRDEYKDTVTWEAPFLAGTFNVRITLSSENATDLELGEILAGVPYQVGATLANVPIQVKSDGIISTKENGDIYLQNEGDRTKVYTIFDYSILFNTEELDYIIKKCSELINSRIVLYGDDSDEQRYSSLVVYGLVRDASPNFRSSSSKSDIKIQIRRFK